MATQGTMIIIQAMEAPAKGNDSQTIFDLTTVALEIKEQKTVTLPRDKMGTAVNRVSYFIF